MIEQNKNFVQSEGGKQALVSCTATRIYGRAAASRFPGVVFQS